MISRNFSLSLLVTVFALLASGSLWAQSPKLEAGRQTACCANSSGQRVCGDIVPPQCAGREIKVYNRQGMLVRIIPARMTEQEKASVDAEEKAKLAAEAAVREKRHQDQALLDTYTSLAEIDRMQKRAEELVTIEINNIQIKIAASKKKKQELDQQVTAHPGDNVPPALAKSIHDEEMNQKTQNELLEAKNKERELIRQRFSRDRERYKELTSGDAGKL
ncbi:MAG: hypothetical protein LBQ75_01925 [Zoogloeaceae bacterium]|jgi:hypothetical protein|nr:hypothetical protein [Zoogloeaceae bacterium]